MNLFKSLASSMLREGGQAAENLIVNLARDSGNTDLRYTRVEATPAVMAEVKNLLTILRSKGFIDPREPSYYLGSSRLFAIKAGLKAPQPNEIETREVIDKALQAKKNFGDVDLDVYYAEGVNTSTIKNFLNTEYPGKYAASAAGEEVNVAAVIGNTNDVVQIDIVNIKGKEKYFGINQFASMADMAVGIKGVVREALIRSIAATTPIDPVISKEIDQKVKESDQYKAFVAKYGQQGTVGYDVRYSLAGPGLAYRISWLVDGIEKNFSKGGVAFDQLQKFVAGQNIQPVAYEELERMAAIMGFKNVEDMKHVVKMGEIVKTMDEPRRQKIWDSLVKNIKQKLPANGRTQGQISNEEAKTAIDYLKPFFGDINFGESRAVFGESIMTVKSEAIGMPSIAHIDQMTPKEFCRLFDGGSWEVSEKYDGSNVSFGVDSNGNLYLKSKKGKPIYEEHEFMEMAEKYNNDIFEGFARLLKALKGSEVGSFLQKVNAAYGAPVQIFGEMFSKSHMNVIPYSDEFIGPGAVVIFGIHKLNEVKGLDITTTEEGQAIKDQIIEELNGADGWKFYDKKPIMLGVEDDIKERISASCNVENMAILASRKRTGPEAELKKQAKADFIALQADVKRALLGKLGRHGSSLGADEIEGAIIRNMQTGAIAKLVDLEGFGRRRAEQWAGVDALKEYRKGLFQELRSDVLNNADIFILSDKQIQKLQDAMEVKGSRFETIDQMLDVLYNDADSEVPFSDAKQMVFDLTDTLNAYRKGVEQSISHIKKDDVKGLADTEKAIDAERSRVNNFIVELNKRLLNNQNPYLSVIEFILGPKVLDELRNKFLAAIK